MIKQLYVFIVAIALFTLAGCSSSNRWPDPYSGYKHTSLEHGYWKEDGDSGCRIRELHLHTAGFSVTFEPFETYKDYWGDYSLDPASGTINISIKSGNSLPEFQKASGTLRMQDKGHLTISGVRLDNQRPRLSSFNFTRFNPSQN